MIGVLGSALILSACGEEDAQGASDNEGNEEPAQEETISNDETSEMNDNRDEGESAEEATVGVPVTIDGAEITVDNPLWVTKAVEYDEPQYDGYFVINATIENKTDEPIEGLDYTFTLRTPDGEIFQESYASRQDTNFSEISSVQPNSKVKGQIAFDVPQKDEYQLVIDPKVDGDEVKITILKEDIAIQ
ncbi:DUF4352 domain-containing protein [Alkalihalobacillus sp. AL-G]|uniref:DUF4352 domain-containing protein n=1 Tax=Alkalihalobacillus sp. AL-G TaxID=2926399 RepID=UPI00272982D6|nr:DUF4352 domain-containing protein [Alkalihalobacillus sp. AL-G]WLD93914.1 DUF4352 domain-containing protein [Alkalihalobacillus sp. AL-G]